MGTPSVCFVGTDRLGLAQLAAALTRRRGRSDILVQAMNVVPDDVAPAVRDVLAELSPRPYVSAPRPLDPARLDRVDRVIIVGGGATSGSVPPGEDWPEPPPVDPADIAAVRALRDRFDRRAADLVDELLIDPDQCCGEGCATCVLDR